MSLDQSAGVFGVTEYYRICAVPSRQPAKSPERRRWTLSELESLRHEEEQRILASSKCFCLPLHLSGTEDVETWPDDLQYFVFNLPHADAVSPEMKSTSRVYKALRKHYPEDEVLMRFADFVESAGRSDPSVMFSYKLTDDNSRSNRT